MDSRVVFLDRDGVINHDSDAYIKSAEEWVPIPGSLEAMAELSAAKFRVVVVTNQSGVGRGLLSEAALSAIHDKMQRELAKHGGQIDGIFVCPHLPEDGCGCRKPAAGLINRAATELDLEVAEAPFVGDRLTDVQAARAAGCLPVLVQTGGRGDWDAAEVGSDTALYTDLAAFVEGFLRSAPCRSAGPSDPS